MFLPANVGLSYFLPNIVENILFHACPNPACPFGFYLDYHAMVYHPERSNGVLAFLSGLYTCATFFSPFGKFGGGLDVIAQGFAARARLELF